MKSVTSYHELVLPREINGHQRVEIRSVRHDRPDSILGGVVCRSMERRVELDRLEPNGCLNRKRILEGSTE